MAADGRPSVRGPRQRGARRVGGAHVARAPDLRRAPGWPGKREERAALERAAASAPFRGMPAPLATLDVHGARPLSRHALGASRRAAGFRHAGRGRLSDRPQRHAAHQGRRSTARSTGSDASRSARSPAIRSRTPRRSSSRRWRGRCRSDSRIRSTWPRRSPRWTRRRDPAGRRARRAVRADAVVHEPAGGTHCGQCSKCRERRDAFHDAGVADPTSYATVPVR